MPADDMRDARPNCPTTDVRWTAGFDAGDRTGDVWADLTRHQRMQEGVALTRLRRLVPVRTARLFRCYDHQLAASGASDAELHRLAGPLGRLHVEDVRWDVIGVAHGGRRYRI